jgi:SAM-dependent methyltransferase
MKDRNIEWFHANHGYQDDILKLDTYLYARQSLERELQGVSSLLDVGNGGFFNYDISQFDRVVALDLFIDGHAPLPPNVTPIAGDALDFSIDEKFDRIVLQNVIHHIPGTSPREAVANIKKVMANCRRHLNHDGRIILIESTVPWWFYAFEKVVFKPLLKLWNFPHPLVLQHTADRLLKSAHEVGLRSVDYAFLPKGKWLLQFGIRFPSAATPARLVKLVLVPTTHRGH